MKTLTTSIPADVPVGPYYHAEHGRGIVLHRSPIAYPGAVWRECVFQPTPDDPLAKPHAGDLIVAGLAIVLVSSILACLVILAINFLT